MTNLRTLLLLSLALTVVACGGGSSTDSSTGGAAPGNATAGGTAPEGAPAASAMAEVDELHHALAPVFHMEAGAARAAAACEHSARFASLSHSIQTDDPPSSADAAAWATASSSLATTADALASECSAAGPDAEARMLTFHDAFHAVLDAAGTRSANEPAAAAE